MSSEFGKWADERGFRKNGLQRQAAWEGYEARQSEIDALVHDNASLYKNLNSETNERCRLDDENIVLKAENERLRKAAEEFMDYFNPGADADRSPEQIVAFLRSYEDKLRSTMRDFPAVVMDTE
jgi:hypothetical protein